MNKSAIYGFVALLTASTITALSITDSFRSNAQNSAQTPSPSTTTPAPSSMGMKTQVDQSFIEMMIPHHQSAVEMADLALSRSKNPEIKKLAESIKTDQTSEIKEMQTWYKQWYGTQVPASSMNMGMHSGMGHGMMMSMQQQDTMDNSMVSALKNASNFDQEFLREMIPHHEMAVMMAGLVVNSAEHPEIRNLAKSIIKSQSAEITQMQQLMSQLRNQ